MSTIEERSHCGTPCNNSPVTIYLEDTVGAIFLGIVASILLIGWMRSEARNRTFVVKP